MLAVRFHDRRDVRVEDVPSPDAVEPGQIRVRPTWCGICGSDLHEYQDGPLYIEEMPQILGHEFSAEVVEVGPGVTHVRAGDRCAVLPHVFCTRCHYCLRGQQGLCRELRLTGVTWPWGGLAEEAVVPGYQAVRLPDDVSAEQGALLEPLASAARGVERSGLQPGQTVLVTGTGPIGQLALLAAGAAGAGAIFVSEPNAARRESAERLGAAGAFDPTATDVAAELRERTDGLGVDVAIECAGAQAALDLCVDATRAGGTVSQVALHVGTRTVMPETWVWKDLTLRGSWSFRFYDAQRLLAQIGAGRLPVDTIVTARIPLTETVSTGMRLLGDPAGEEGKVLVSMQGSASTAASRSGPDRRH